MTTWKEHKKQLLKNPQFKAEYDDLEPGFLLAKQLIEARLKMKMTQTELATKSGVSRVVIARLESGTSNPTLETITRVASSLGKRVELTAS